MLKVSPTLSELAAKADALYKNPREPLHALESVHDMDSAYLSAIGSLISFISFAESRPQSEQ